MACLWFSPYVYTQIKCLGKKWIPLNDFINLIFITLLYLLGVWSHFLRTKFVCSVFWLGNKAQQSSIYNSFKWWAEGNPGKISSLLLSKQKCLQVWIQLHNLWSLPRKRKNKSVLYLMFNLMIAAIHFAFLFACTAVKCFEVFWLRKGNQRD